MPSFAHDRLPPDGRPALARRRASRHPLTALCAALLLAGCAVGPDYQPPPVPDGARQAAFEEDGPWRPAAPKAADADSPWWHRFGDPQLDALVAQAMAASPTLAQASATYRQAQALVDGASAGFFPTVGASASGGRGRSKVNGNSMLGDTHAWSLQAGWEPDFFGKVRRGAEAAADSAQASAADLAAARLALQAAVVNDYIQLRLDDRQKALYSRTVAGYRDSLRLAQAQYRAGTALRSDVALAESNLASAEAQAIDIDLTRRQLEHALAVLLGRTPGEFSLPPLTDEAASPLALPVMPPGLPSQLLERRPDIAGAERRVAAANAQIGVATAAYYPDFTLNASGGFSGAGLTAWARTPDKVWALGFALAASLYDGGARSAKVAQARAAFDGAAAGYRQTVLAAFQDVEDNLAALRELAREREAQGRAVSAARDSLRVVLSQYRAGTANYTTVVTTQALALTAERTALQLEGRQYAASVALVKALGGGWDAGQLPAIAHASDAAAHPPATPMAAPAATAPSATSAELAAARPATR
nr:efflux transporter outer membrane subunit [uncultured Pseudacidovorax sp.]